MKDIFVDLVSFTELFNRIAGLRWAQKRYNVLGFAESEIYGCAMYSSDNFRFDSGGWNSAEQPRLPVSFSPFTMYENIAWNQVQVTYGSSL
jgi:hypothetical protein